MRRRQRTLAVAAAILGAVTLSACTGTQDPAQAGFLDGVGNLTSGTYDRRIQEREVAAATANAQADALARRAAELEGERQMLAAEEASARARLQRVNAEVYAQQQRVSQLRSAQNIDQIQLSRIEARINELQRQLQAAQSSGEPGSDAEIVRLEQEIRDLRQLIDGMVATVAVTE